MQHYPLLKISRILRGSSFNALTPLGVLVLPLQHHWCAFEQGCKEKGCSLSGVLLSIVSTVHFLAADALREKPLQYPKRVFAMWVYYNAVDGRKPDKINQSGLYIYEGHMIMYVSFMKIYYS